MYKSLIIFLFLFPLISSITEDEMRKRMQALYGENKEITGDYDKTL